jgi:hypothetical protein
VVVGELPTTTGPNTVPDGGPYFVVAYSAAGKEVGRTDLDRMIVDGTPPAGS